jgi:hypothetical protein
VGKIARRPKPKADRTKAQLAKLIADVEALKTASNEMAARLAKVEVVREPSPTTETPVAPYTGEEPQKPETE